MATTAYCLFCFECLSSSLKNREPLRLAQVDELWEQSKLQKAAIADDDDEDDDDDVRVGNIDDEDEDMDPIPTGLKPPSFNRLQVPSPSSASSSSTPSSLSTTSSQAGLGSSSKSSSSSSFFSFGRKTRQPEVEYPLFVTWNTINGRGHKNLRGCIGTFEAQEIENGLKNYALTSAFDDTRFSPITVSELPSLSVGVTLLTDFESCSNPLDWSLGTHGLRISFTYHSKRYGATYLPDVALEQGWTKEETIISLMRKAGWSGRSSDWKKVGDLRCVRYQGKKAALDHREWKSWRDWVDKLGLI